MDSMNAFWLNAKDFIAKALVLRWTKGKTDSLPEPNE